MVLNNIINHQAAVEVYDILNIVYPEDLAIQHDIVLIQSSQVIDLVMELIKGFL